MLLSLPPVVLEKSGCCNAVTEARLLPLVHTSAQNRKYAFHERGGWLNQRDVLCNIITTRQLKPIVIPESPQIVRACRARLKAVVRGELERSHSSEGNLVLAIAARSQNRKIGYAAASLALSAFFGLAWACGRARVSVCVFMCSYVGPSNIAINRADNK